MPKTAQETARHIDTEMLCKVAETRLSSVDETELIPLRQLCTKYGFTPADQQIAAERKPTGIHLIKQMLSR